MNRVRAYRDLEGINQQELGDIFGISGAMISQIESGRKAPTIDLEKIGYASARLRVTTMSDPLHRHRASTKAADKKRARELLRLGGEVFVELRARTPKAPTMSLERVPSPRSLDEVEGRADEVRSMLMHESSGPIANLTALAERAGVCIIPIAGMDGVDGLSAWVGDDLDEEVAVIGLSPTVPGDRFRHTLAHEIGHLSMHRRKSEVTEDEAHRFAGALLFPEADFDEAMDGTLNLTDFVELKRSWGVSVGAIVYRAHELGYIDDQRYRALQIQMSRWRRKEPATFDARHGRLFQKLIEVNGGVDVVARELGVNRKHLATLVDWRHLRVA